MITFHIITLFPESIRAYLDESIIGRAQKNAFIRVKFYNPRDFTRDKHRRTDGRPYGGGPGMVMWAEPIVRAVEKARGKKKGVPVFLFSPSGMQFDSAMAMKLAKKSGDIVFIAGRYEGVDARVKKILRARELSIGPYILSGGELPSAVCVDAIARHVSGVLGHADSIEETRVASPEVYARPEDFVYKKKHYRVPPVLLSGSHKLIEEWKKSKRDKPTR